MERQIPPAPSLPAFFASDAVPKSFNTSSEHFSPLRLHFAINARDIDGVRKEIAEGLDLNFFAPTNGQTPLTMSIHTQQYEIALLLLSAGADASVAEKANGARQPIHLAARAGQTELVSTILVRQPHLVTATDAMNFTPLHYAAIAGKLSVIKLLLERGALVNKRDDRGRTALFRAIEQQHIDVAEELVSAGAELDYYDNFGWSAIYQSAVCGHLNAVKFLLERGADLNDGGCNKLCPLHAACGLLTVDMAMAVLHDTGYDYDLRRAHVSTPCSHHTVAAIDSSDYRHNLEMVDLLIDFGADVNKYDAQGATPVKCAAYLNRQVIIKLLVSAGANLRRERWLFNPDHRALASLTDPKFTEWLRHLALITVPPLTQMCRLAVRRALRPRKRNNIALLPIPTTLKQYLEL